MYEVLASYGHVRDLARRSGSVRPDDDFSIVWEVPSNAWTHLKSIRVALSCAEYLILASDPDREGEAIAWHITEMLKQQDALNENITVARVVFHEITESSIKRALQNPRDLDSNLVNAYLARRALDYLIGFSISPLLWRKLPGCQSAGRVQSAALALICDREMEIEQFNPQEYWTIGVEFCGAYSDLKEKSNFLSCLTKLNSKKLEQLSIISQAEAEAIRKRIDASLFEVIDVKKSKVQRNPPMPYITSTLQQDSANKFHFTAAYTMKLAQQLYEGIKLSDEEATGLITYMRTDGMHVSNEAAEDINVLVKERYGEKFASKGVRTFFKKVKNSQEAHEAIRPTNIRRLPSTLVGVLDADCLKLYTLIWTRSMACQMEAASFDLIQVDIGNKDGDVIFHSAGLKIGFLGYQAVYKDKEAAFDMSNETEPDANEAAFLALHELKVKDKLSVVKVDLNQHYTKPFSRYSEGALVKKLEELGIGRPSTYASIMKVLQDRKYVTTRNRVLHPEFRGRMVAEFLSQHFSEVADYGFTADMENELDNVSAGSTDWKGLLKDYWSRFSSCCALASNLHIRQVEKMLEEKFGHIIFSTLPSDSRVCPSCEEGTLRLKVSRFGSGYFIGCDQHPNCKYIAGSLFNEEDEAADSDKLEASFPPRLLGCSPNSNQKIYLKKGPYGHYVQLGEDIPGSTPKRSSITEVQHHFYMITRAIMCF
ncbi:DNA topoisomerase I [Apostasia shenzhenica]|uniref:DNA topoisomerase n=1 Tax=Apostasia shenzhenica TaxID=1088818 RepID=A0A2I0AWB6_9ASPA|nr:DNA topoisomerase I [Apostasia shenzhenica]